MAKPRRRLAQYGIRPPMQLTLRKRGPFERAKFDLNRPTTNTHASSSKLQRGRITRERQLYYDRKEDIVHQEDALSDFVDLINATQDELAEELTSELENAERTATKYLDDTAATLAEKARPFQSTMKQLQDLIANPQFLLPAQHRDGLNTVLSEERGLNQLWDEWHQVHEEILCLMVEVLGFKQAKLPLITSQKVLNKVSGAEEVFIKQDHGRVAMVELMDKYDKEILALTADTLKQLKLQQKFGNAEIQGAEA
ncbi:hypothetical protein FQN57_000273 [Myotisia sp. PD_48]|nr:hypothetical protein FQN57_000273 [Myotisia sp. PD_48]